MKRKLPFSLILLFCIGIFYASHNISAQSTVMITEISSPAVNADGKIVEICNRGEDPVDISGWKLELYNNGSTSPNVTLTVDGGIILDENECFVFLYGGGNNPIKPADLNCDYESTGTGGGNGNDEYRLKDDADETVDVYGKKEEVTGRDDYNVEWNYRWSIVTRRIIATESNPDFDLNEWHINKGTGSGNGPSWEDVTPCVDQPNGPLPVTWVSFNAVQGMNGVDLLWQTSEEFNNEYFEVQRSVDGIEWTALDRVEPLTEDGSTSRATFNNYKYRDITPLAGMNYYRIKQVDIDAEYDYSEVRSVHVQGEKTDILLSPNPASTILNIYAADEIVRMDIYDMRGERVMESMGDVNRLDIAHFTPGIYYLSILTESGQVSKKFVKQ